LGGVRRIEVRQQRLTDELVETGGILAPLGAVLVDTGQQDVGRALDEL
jgi:hypothetical protein